MIIEKVNNMPDELRGRPSTYPFKELLPGHKLIVPHDNEPDLEYLRKKIGSALYQYKKSNNLKWKTAVRIELGNISVYRIS